MSEAVRKFQWFYTRHVWTPYELTTHSTLSQTEWRVLFAVMHAGTTIAADLSRALQINTGYLSRLLNDFERSGLIVRSPFAGDARSRHISLAAAGERVLAAASTHVRNNVSTALEAMTPDEGSQLMASMELVERLLTLSQASPGVRLRRPRPGDFGWIVEREAQLGLEGGAAKRAREIRAARVVAEYLTAPDPTRNGCWIAEKDGASAGAALLISKPSSADARISVLFVGPDSRREGIGRRLLEACQEFAIESGYERIDCVVGFHHDLATPLLRSCGFQQQPDDGRVWEKYLT